jgi:hypothetical protein
VKVLEKGSFFGHRFCRFEELCSKYTYMNIQTIKKKIDALVSLSDTTIASLEDRSARMVGSVIRTGGVYADEELFHQLRAGGLTFIQSCFGPEHIYYREFSLHVRKAVGPDAIAAKGILKAIQSDIEDGWLFSIKSLLAAEIFTDFLDMAKHLLEQGYKDPAAVMIGGVLEEHLRQLCDKNDIENTVTTRDGKDMPKSSDRRNNDLAGAGVYSKLYQKNIAGWLDLRNKAAHGNYTEYDVRQVEIMEAGVSDFVAKTATV